MHDNETERDLDALADNVREGIDRLHDKTQDRAADVKDALGDAGDKASLATRGAAADVRHVAEDAEDSVEDESDSA